MSNFWGPACMFEGHWPEGPPYFNPCKWRIILRNTIIAKEEFPKLHLKAGASRYSKLVHYILGFATKMLVLKKNSPSYTSRWIPQSTEKLDFKFLYKAFSTKYMCSRRIPQATPQGGYLEVQKKLFFKFYIRLLVQIYVLKKNFPSYTSGWIPQGTVAMLNGIIIRKWRLLLQNVSAQEGFPKLYLQVDTWRYNNIHNFHSL